MRTRSWLGTAIALTIILYAVLCMGACLPSRPELTFYIPQEGDAIGPTLSSVVGGYKGVPESKEIWLVASQNLTCWPIAGPASKENGLWQIGQVGFPGSGGYRLYAILADANGANELSRHMGRSEGIPCWPKGVEPISEIAVAVLAPTSTPTPTLTPTPTPRIPSGITPIPPSPTPGTYSISGRVFTLAEDKYVGLSDIRIILYSNPDGCESQIAHKDYRNDQIPGNEAFLNGDELFLLNVHTLEDGSYAFRNRLPGCYLVQVAPEDDQGSALVDIQEVLVEDRDVQGMDFVIEPRLGSIGVRVWLDENHDGEWQEGEGSANDDLPINLWRDANCDGWPENRTSPLLPPYIAQRISSGTYRFSDLPLESCYMVEFQTTDRVVPTRGEATVHVCLLEACLEDEPHKLVEFGYYVVPPPTANPVPSIMWWRVDSAACNDHQMITAIQRDPGGTHLNIYGRAKAPPSARFEKFELDYALEGCITLESCYLHLASGDCPSPSPLYAWPLPDGLEQGQKILLRLRVIASAAYDDGCKAWIIIP